MLLCMDITIDNTMTRAFKSVIKVIVHVYKKYNFVVKIN